MRLTVLGKSPSWPDAGGACSGYLLEDGGTRLLLDCGPGVFAKLREVAEYDALDALVLSHLHADHVLDVVPYASGLRFGPRAAKGGPRPALHAPPGGAEGLAALSDSVGMGREHAGLAFDLTEYDPDAVLAIGALELRFRAVPHYVPTFAIDVRGPGGRITYSADCGPNDGLVELAEGTDLLLVEATLPEAEPDDGEAPGHLSARQAGEQGRRAGARRVVITHLTDELDADAAREEAERGFGGPVEVARGGAVFTP